MTDINLNHIAIVVDDLDAALRFWRDAPRLDRKPATFEFVPGEAVEIAMLRLGNAHIELSSAHHSRQRRRQIPGQARTRPAPLLPRSPRPGYQTRGTPGKRLRAHK